MPSILAAIVPELLMPPAKLEIFLIVTLLALRSPTTMPVPVLAVIVPELVMPPPKLDIVTLIVEVLPIKMPLPSVTVIVPELLMPPETVAWLVTKMPLP